MWITFANGSKIRQAIMSCNGKACSLIFPLPSVSHFHRREGAEPLRRGSRRSVVLARRLAVGTTQDPAMVVAQHLLTPGLGAVVWCSMPMEAFGSFHSSRRSYGYGLHGAPALGFLRSPC